MIATEKMTIKEEFLTHFSLQDYSFDVDFSLQARESALDSLQNLEFPTSKTEYWKYTRLNKYLKSKYKIQYPNEDLELDLAVPSKRCLVFVNGYYVPALSWGEDIKGLHLSSLSDAKKSSNVLNEKFDSLSNKREIFSMLNTAYHQDGAFLHLEKNTILEEEIHLVFIHGNDGVLSNTRNFIYLEQGSQCKLVIKQLSLDAAQSFSNTLSEVFVEENANLEINKIQDRGNANYQIDTEEISQDKSSFFKINTFSLSGGMVRNNLNIDLRGERTESWLSGLYPLNGKQHVDNHTLVNHREPNCESNELYKGILDEQSTAVFNGKVHVHQKAQKTNAYQSNANIVLTDEASINSKPELEIYADDVKCSHGSTTGQLDEEAIFYLRSRGLSKRSARAVLVNAFASDVIDQIGVETVKEEITEYINLNYRGA